MSFLSPDFYRERCTRVSIFIATGVAAGITAGITAGIVVKISLPPDKPTINGHYQVIDLQ